ncbi:MAG: hypothetical protein OXI41_15200 [Chloroflexota bacterium]|nr:hypothetical protein [Chloroflexota bacterium]
MHDGITFEQYGKPGLVLCTHPFDPTGRMIARTLGMPDFRYALVDHPIGSTGIEGLQARALDAFEQGRSILLGD